MRTAIMQPYIFPYLPYFQLIHAVDCFVIFDTVQFIRRGWMNRNRIKLNGSPHTFSLPIQKIERGALASEIVFAENAAIECRKLQALLKHAYGKARQWDQLKSVVTPLLTSVEPQMPFVDFAQTSLSTITTALGIETKLVRASELILRKSDVAQEYIIDLCLSLGASEYVNAIGGEMLYDKEKFISRGLNLYFLQSDVDSYPQTKGDFINDLSILDLLANLETTEIQKLLTNYRLLSPS